MPQQTRDQARAAHAWNFAESVKNGKRNADRFGIEAKKMPVRILNSGLGPALAFLAAKKYAPTLQEALNDWITKHCDWAKHSVATGAPDQDLIQRIISEDSEFLRMATAECLAYLQWLVRFCDSLGLVKDQD
jgi:CRISPR-associated protein Cmr5